MAFIVVFSTLCILFTTCVIMLKMSNIIASCFVWNHIPVLISNRRLLTTVKNEAKAGFSDSMHELTANSILVIKKSPLFVKNPEIIVTEGCNLLEIEYDKVQKTFLTDFGHSGLAAKFLSSKIRTPHSPHMVLSTFWPFPKLKMPLRNRHVSWVKPSYKKPQSS